MPNFSNMLAVVLRVFICALIPHAGWSDEACDNCGIKGDIKDFSESKRGPFPGLLQLKCYEQGLPYSFDEGFCMAYYVVEGQEDFEDWIQQCQHTDPQNRSTIIEYMDTIKCESELIRSVAVKYPDAGIAESLIPLNQYMIYQDTDVAKVADFFRHLMKSFRDEGKGRGYPELKAFVGTLNKLDPNGMTFLDNVLLRYDDEFNEEVMFEHQRNRMIRNLCRVGARFSPSTNIDGLRCNPLAEYTE